MKEKRMDDVRMCRMSSFRHNAGFGKRIEYSIIAQMLKEGMDVYVPLVADNGIDAVVRREDGSFVEVQIKARSRDVNPGDEALFAGIRHEWRPNYWFVFYAEGVRRAEDDGEPVPITWVMSSKEFLDESYCNKKGKNVGSRTIWFNGRKKGVSYAKKEFDKYIVEKLSDRILRQNTDKSGEAS